MYYKEIIRDKFGKELQLRKCHKGELGSIIDIANRCFIADRSPDFTFINSVPHIYNNDIHDYSDIHFVVETDWQIVALGGNLISELNFDNKKYRFARVGTVGTLVNYRNRGYMRKIMSIIEQEDKNDDVVFSVLIGDKNIYNRYGYNGSCLSLKFFFNKFQLDHLKRKKGMIIRKYNNDDMEKIYQLYLNNQSLVLRNKEEFILHLNNNTNDLYVIIFNGETIGYYSIKNNMIMELVVNDASLVESCISNILLNVDYERIVVYASMLNYDVNAQLEKISIYKEEYKKLCIKVYDLKRFIEILYNLNKIKIKGTIEEVYKINNYGYEFVINDKGLSIQESNKKANKYFENEENFLDFVLGASNDNTNSKIFPLYFDLSMADKF